VTGCSRSQRRSSSSKSASALPAGGQLGASACALWPSYLSYATSLVTIGIIWINHHHNVRVTERPDRTFMFINLQLLLDVAFIPSARFRC